MRPLNLALLGRKHFYHLCSIVALHSARVPSALFWRVAHGELKREQGCKLEHGGEVCSEFGLRFPLRV